MMFVQFLAFVTAAVGVPLNLYVTIRLWRLSRQRPDLRVLRDRAIVATIVLILVLVFGLVFLNNDLIPPVVSFDDTKIYARLAMVTVAIAPATYWLRIYR